MDRLIPVNKKNDILSKYTNTPIGELFEYHNLKHEFRNYQNAQILIGMCMDNRKHLHIPNNFAFIIRTGGANLRYNEFQISFAISVGGVKHIALIGHNNCGMVDLFSRKEQFINGLVNNAGWNIEDAEKHFLNYEPVSEIGNEVDFILDQTNRLRIRYPKILTAPILYNIDDNNLYMIKEY
jgi:carbonic anhydrase